ncbi:MAG TPA: DUF4097 family beta strand repeat-containing protein [Terriglobales bacterium]
MARAEIRIPLAVLSWILLLSLTAAATDYQGSFERKFPLTGPAQLEIDTGSWDVTVHGGPSGTVTVVGKIHVGNRWLLGDKSTKVHELESNPPVQQNGNIVRVNHVSLNNIWIDYDVTVPGDTRVKSRTGSGDVKIQDLASDLDLQSGSGDVWLENITGKIQTRSGSGDVRARAISGSFSADASSGDIRLEERGKGDVDIRTTSGNVEAKGVDGALHLEATSGDISAEGKPSNSWEARAGSGNIHLSLPRDAAFQLDASTSSGELSINHAVTITVQGNLDTSRHAIKGTVGSGGPLVIVHTGSGDIDIE